MNKDENCLAELVLMYDIKKGTTKSTMHMVQVLFSSKHQLVLIRTFQMGKPSWSPSAVAHSQSKFSEVLLKAMNIFLFLILAVRNVLEEKY